MSSSMPEDLSRSKGAPIQKTDNRPKLSLANQTFETPTNRQQMETDSESNKSVEKIHTFIIWSIFNLLFVSFGILCCYFSHKVNQFKIQNRYKIAKKWSKRTFVLNTITTLLMIGTIIIIVMLRYDFNQQNSDSQFNQTRTTGAYIPWQPGR